MDDDPGMAKFISAAVEEAGFKAHRARNVDAGFALLKKEKIDLVLLDIELPGFSGLQMLDLMKKDPATAELPVILLTVKGEEDFKLKGLTGGADDYVVKPFSSKELAARIEAVLRRSRPGASPDVVQAAGVRLDGARREVSYKGKVVDLRPAEFTLLATFLRSPGRILSHEELGRALGHADAKTEVLHTHIKNLRAKLHPDLIETVHGFGYRLSEK